MKSIENLQPVYFSNEVDIERELFAPIFSRATSCKSMMAYFTSGALYQLAGSLADFLSAEATKIDFVVSPYLNKEDIEAIKSAINTDKNLLPLLFPEFEYTESHIKDDVKLALSYLVATQKINIRVGLTKPDALLHTKVWVFETDAGRISVSGSGNATYNGLTRNVEEFTVRKESSGYTNDIEAIDVYENRFEKMWNGTYQDIETIELNSRTIEEFKKAVDVHGKDKIDIQRLIDSLKLDTQRNQKDENESTEKKLTIPDWLNYTEGDFAHQGEAISHWEKNGRRGVLSIATGGGKTLTSLTAATLVQNTESCLFLVISVPTTVLVSQWTDEVSHFGITPISSKYFSGNEIVRQLKKASRNLRLNVSRCEVLIISHDLLKKDKVVDAISQIHSVVKTMLIGDEVHNLGSTGFINSAPDCFDYRLGLSATVVRQYDEDGTEFLLNYFGPVVFEFTVEEAIGNCLVPFEYYAHEVHLLDDESDEWKDISYKIRKLSYAKNLPDGDPSKEQLQNLYIKRRSIIESATSKAHKLCQILSHKEKIKRTLIFCCKKNRDQLNTINRFLIEKRINFHQITGEETNQSKILQDIISSFSDDKLDVLTAMKVLDEGFNVPQTETAYLLASTTVRKEWIQRLGRVLRKFNGKEFGIIHDFIVVPEISDSDPDFRSLIKGEFDRVMFFSQLSIGGLTKQSGLDIINKLTDIMEN